jgi:Tfp pilus assembly PilM family ATPase
MYKFIKKNPVLGIEITSAAVRVATFSGSGRTVLSVSSAGLQPGIISETYGAVNIHDRDSLVPLLNNCLGEAPKGQRRRAGLSLPDGIFRVQILEFDALPAKDADRERLIRWRLEKTAAFDLSDTLLRYQILRRQGAGFTILACIAKKPVIAQYEALLLELGIEPSSVGLSSFFTLNFYAAYLSGKSPAFALVHLSGDSFATIISENGAARFYRYKDVKRGNGDEMTSRLIREIDDSLHFYIHMDRSQQIELKHLYLSGNPAACESLARELSACTTLAVEVLSPEFVLPSQARPGSEMSAALGAGRAA